MNYRGRELTFKQLSDEFTKVHGVTPNEATIYQRINKHGYTVEQAVETPLQRDRKVNDKLISGNVLSACRHSTPTSTVGFNAVRSAGHPLGVLNEN